MASRAKANTEYFRIIHSQQLGPAIEPSHSDCSNQFTCMACSKIDIDFESEGHAFMHQYRIRLKRFCHFATEIGAACRLI
jgi:hypothetical protein